MPSGLFLPSIRVSEKLALHAILIFTILARRAGSDGSMSSFWFSRSGFRSPAGVINFHLKIFNLGARRVGDVHFIIARLYIKGLD